MRFAFVAENAELGISRLCRTLGVSRTGFYAWRDRPPSPHDVEDDRLRVLVHEAHVRGRRTYGSPRVHLALRRQQIFVSRKRVIRLMQGAGSSRGYEDGTDARR